VRSKIFQEILDETPEDVKIFVKKNFNILTKVETMEQSLLENENLDKEGTTQLNMDTVRRNCVIVQYGSEERLCRKCGYVLWDEKGKTNEEIIGNMVKSGYKSPSCYEK
jgi:hypothetical protein